MNQELPNFRDRHFLAEAKRILGPERYGDMRPMLATARWRATNGLEARALVAMLHAPGLMDRVRNADDDLTPADFLTLPYAALAAALLDPEIGDRAAELGREAIERRPYAPSCEEAVWEEQASRLTDGLLGRRRRR